jgi:hypothetical protein
VQARSELLHEQGAEVIPLLLALLYVEFTQPAYKPTAPISAKPFVVSWAIRWKPPLTETMHSKRFRYAREAVEFELAAPLCSAQAPPCVAWIKSDVVSINPKFKTAALRKKVSHG